MTSRLVHEADPLSHTLAGQDGASHRAWALPAAKRHDARRAGAGRELGVEQVAEPVGVCLTVKQARVGKERDVRVFVA